MAYPISAKREQNGQNRVCRDRFSQIQQEAQDKRDSLPVFSALFDGSSQIGAGRTRQRLGVYGKRLLKPGAYIR
jgi:hypothetical protein